MDLGAEALFDTIEVMQGMEIEVCGAGGNIEAARRPAILQRNGVRVAFLGYCSVPRQGHAAGSFVGWSSTNASIYLLRALG